MPNIKDEATLEYEKELRRIKRAIRELTQEGYEVNYKIPKRPKKITKASVSRLKKVSRSTIRKHSKYKNPKTGKKTSGEKQYKKKRSEAAKKSAKTKKNNQESLYDSFEKKYLPAENNVVVNSFIRQTGRYFFSQKELERILDIIFDAPNDPRWLYARSKYAEVRNKAIRESERCSNLLANYIKAVLTANEDVFLNVSETTFSIALEKTLFGYSESEVKLGFNDVMRYLGSDVKSAEEYIDDDEYIDI